MAFVSLWNLDLSCQSKKWIVSFTNVSLLLRACLDGSPYSISCWPQGVQTTRPLSAAELLQPVATVDEEYVIHTTGCAPAPCEVVTVCRPLCGFTLGATRGCGVPFSRGPLKRTIVKCIERLPTQCMGSMEWAERRYRVRHKRVGWYWC